MYLLIARSSFLIISPSKVILLFQRSKLDMPSVKRVFLPHAFEVSNDCRIIGSHYSFLLSHLGIGKLKYVFSRFNLSYPSGFICNCTTYYSSLFNQTHMRPQSTHYSPLLPSFSIADHYSWSSIFRTVQSSLLILLSSRSIRVKGIDSRTFLWQRHVERDTDWV